MPNPTFRHIIIDSNEGKPVTQSRDSQEVPYKQGKEMLKLMFNHNSKTSMLDSFSEYENRRNFRPKSLYNSNSNNKKTQMSRTAATKTFEMSTTAEAKSSLTLISR